MSEPCARFSPDTKRLLGPDDPSPVVVTNEGGSSPFLLVGDHAGRGIPARLGGLGVTAEALDWHIAWDIGVAAVGERLARTLDACFIRQTYSRLVIDCNRAPGSAGSILPISDGVTVPRNLGLGADDIAARTDEIYQPYQSRIAAALDRRRDLGWPTLFVSLHSFTPVFDGFKRPWHYGVLHRSDSALSSRMLALLEAEIGDEAGDNQPYALDEKDHTVPLHADPRGLDYLELEVRQDLIGETAGQDAAAALIARLLAQALS